MNNRILPAVEEGQQQEQVRSYSVRICDQCIRLEGEMCHNPECVFCRRTMAEVREYLDATFVRPTANGEHVFTAEQVFGMAESAESTLSQIRQVLEKFKPLHEAATPAPFDVYLGRTIIEVTALDCRIYQINLNPDLLKVTHDRQRADAKLFVELRNAYPELLALLGKEK